MTTTFDPVAPDTRDRAAVLGDTIAKRGPQRIQQIASWLAADMHEIWCRNIDEDGNPVLIPDPALPEPTGQEIVIAMGDKALGRAAAHKAGVEYVVGQATALGIPIDAAKMAPPMTWEWLPDGSADPASFVAV